MATLNNAPLLEVSFRLFWGRVTDELEPGARLSADFTFSTEERQFFAGEFKRVAADQGFVHAEEGGGAQPRPFWPTAGFRREKGSYPFFQIGLGLLSVRQGREGYDWNQFKESVLLGITMLRESWHGDVADLPLLGADLLYSDAFEFAPQERATNFLEKNLRLKFDLPPDFLDHPALDPGSIGADIFFTMATKEPVGTLSFELLQTAPEPKPGYLMNTVLRSPFRENATTLDGLGDWLETAHQVQRHVFKTLIQPRFASTFQ